MNKKIIEKMYSKLNANEKNILRKDVTDHINKLKIRLAEKMILLDILNR